MTALKLRFADVKGKNAIFIISGIVLFVIQIVFTTFFLIGLVDYYGEAIGVMGAINLILDIVNISVLNIFESLLKLVIGIMFIIYTVIHIKNLIQSISVFIKVSFDKKPKNAKLREDLLLSLLNTVGYAVQNCLIFMMVCAMVSVDFTFNSLGIFCLIMGCVCYLSFCIILGYLKNFHAECIFYRVLATLIMSGSFALLISKTQIATFEQGLQAFSALFGGYYGKLTAEVIFQVISSFTFPILFIILQFKLILYVTEVWGIEFYRKSELGKNSSKIIMGISIAIVVCDLALAFIFKGIQINDVQQLFKLVESNLTLLVSSIILHSSYYFEVFTKTNKLQDSSNEETKEEETKKEEPNSNNTQEQSEQTVNNENLTYTPEIPNNHDKIIAELKQYKELVNNGIITQEEFEAKKKQLLNL